MKKLLSMILVLLLLSGCTVISPEPWVDSFDSGTSPTAVIAYIPLDNRPINTTRVQLLAAAAGFVLRMPEESLYRTALDGQPQNPNGTQHGNGDALLQWLEGCDADYYAISVDQILSGGLVNSRCMTELSDEYQKIDRLLSILADKQVVFFDTVMRLAPTVGYQGCTLSEYQSIRSYGSLPRETIEGTITASQVIATYPIPTDLDAAVTVPYLAARARKLQLSEYLLGAISHNENHILYVGVDDSSPAATIQSNEIAMIRQQLKTGHLFSGTDEMGLMAVTRILREHYCRHPLPAVHVRYIGVDPAAPADGYDIGTLSDTVSAHIEALNLSVSQTDYDIALLVYGDDASTQSLFACYRENLQKGIPSMIVDLGSDLSLVGSMIADPTLDLSFLLSYSRWNTAGNAVGIALSNAVARYLYLKYAPAVVSGSNSAFLQGLALSFAKDISYAQTKPKLDDLLISQGYDPGNFYAENSLSDTLSAEALFRMNRAEDPISFSSLAEKLAGKQFLVSLSPCQTGTIPQIQLAGISFPWYRTFEAELTLKLIGSTD